MTQPTPSPVTGVEEETVHTRLARTLETARIGGPQKNRDKIKASGKMLVRERLKMLFDDEHYVEDGLLARFEEGLPGDAVVCAYGNIDGRQVCVIANDFSVKAGTWGKATFEKIIFAQETAVAAGIPIVYLFDSAGARIDEQFESFVGRHAWGNIFYNQVQVSGRVPQVCALFGPSPAGSAYVPALCDLTIMVRGHATAYLGSPRLAEMVTGEVVTLEEMGGAEMHCTVSGLGDVLVEDDEEALNAIRVWLSFLPANWESPAPVAPAVEPREGRKLSEIVPLREAEVFDMEEFVESLVDEGSWFPYKELFAPEMLTGFARINGQPVGLVGNQPTHMGGTIFPDSSDKAARFIWICNAYNIPIVFLVDIAGYMIGSEVERQGIIRHGAKMIFAVSECRVPRITVLVRKAYGGGYLAMSGAPMHPDAVIALPTARPALMGPDAAVNGVYYNQIHAIADEAERKAFVAQKQAEYAEGIDVFKIANANGVEAVVETDHLRDELTQRLRLYLKRPKRAVDRRQAVTPV